MFSEIAMIAKEFNCVFTLYVDDMTFSSTEPISVPLLQRKIDCTLRKYNHKPKYKKVKYYGPKDFKPITGSILTPAHTLKAPNALQHKIYNSFMQLKPKLLNNDTLTEDETKELQSLKGRIQAVRNIDTNKFPEIKRIVNNKDHMHIKK